jgi:transposase-like protein
MSNKGKFERTPFQELELKKWKEQKKFDDAIQAINYEIDKLQEECPHPKEFEEYIPDEWSSYYRCKWCGKVW